MKIIYYSLYLQKQYLLLDSVILNLKDFLFDTFSSIFLFPIILLEYKLSNFSIVLFQNINILFNILRFNKISIINIVLPLILSLILIQCFYKFINLKNKIKFSEQIIVIQNIEKTKKIQTIEFKKALIDEQIEEQYKWSELIHDKIGGNLAGIKLDLSLLLDKHSHPTLNENNQIISGLFGKVRKISKQLTSYNIPFYNLQSLLLKLVYENNNSHNLKIELHFFPNNKINELNIVNKEIIYNIIKELINNIKLHSKATNAIINIIIYKENVNIIISDNGIGIIKSQKVGSGLKKIKQKIISLKGCLKIESNSKKGTEIFIEIPILY